MEKRLLLTNDAQALAASVQASQAFRGFDVDELSSVSLPCLIFAGTADPRYEGAKDGAALMPSATFVSLSELDHAAAFVRIDLVLPHVKSFLAKVSRELR